ncbi:MAG: PhnD/SsuA/transferrin family substrate-binding protein [Burkholderiales bacterium]|nr:PhnD/SsuA/transferrin family substrate-binding protein [Burkholderiales bacterium]
MQPAMLRVTSCMADNAEATCRAITAWLGERLGIATAFVDCIPWQERERELDAGRIHLCWICGLPYVRKADSGRPQIEACVAPVMALPRYAGAPVYYSDIVVRRDSPYRDFAGLRGSAWAYNEPDSHSGHNVVRHRLALLGETGGYFGRAVESGAHQASLRMIADGTIDASAVDSTVLEAEIARRPELAGTLRVIDTLGPSPMPPWVAHRSLDPALRADIRGALLAMHGDPAGGRILAQWGIARFIAVDDAHYDPIRDMARQAAGIPLAPAQSAS